jgi:putative membrane protein
MQLLTTVFADWHHDGPGWWIVFPVLFWVIVIAGLVLLVRSRGGWGPPRIVGAPRETALEVLDRRYAQGEIDVDEYRQRRSVLAERGSPEDQ